MPRAKQRTPELRQKILDSAVTVLDSEGVTAFTTRRVAESAGTSVPAIYELFDDKAGLIRELFFEGFRQLGSRLLTLTPTSDPCADLVACAHTFRSFANDKPRLFEVMYSRPFDVFEPMADERRLGSSTQSFVVDLVGGGVAKGQLQGDPVDIAHGLLALVTGLAGQEIAGWLGSSEASRARRWDVSVNALLTGHAAEQA